MVTTAYDQKLVLQKKNFFKLKVGSKLKKKTEYVRFLHLCFLEANTSWDCFCTIAM